MTEIDSGRYLEIATLIQKSETITDFDLYYLGFFSHYIPDITLQGIFKHMANIVSLHHDQLISNEEKIEFLVRMLSKKVDFDALMCLAPESEDMVSETKRILYDYFG